MKIQSVFKGYMTRKYIKQIKENQQYFQGMSGFGQAIEGQEAYENPNVQQIRQELGDFDYGNDSGDVFHNNHSSTQDLEYR